MRRNADTLNSSGTSGTTCKIKLKRFTGVKDNSFGMYKPKVFKKSITNGGSEALVECGAEQGGIVIIGSLE